MVGTEVTAYEEDTTVSCFVLHNEDHDNEVWFNITRAEYIKAERDRDIFSDRLAKAIDVYKLIQHEVA